MGWKSKQPVHKHDCKETLQKVMLALDGELTSEEEKSFLHELEICSYCLEHYSIEKSFKEFLCQRVSRKNITPSIVESIRKQLFGEMK